MTEKLKALRRGRGLSQPALARRAGVSVWVVRRWEQASHVPLFASVVKVADALGVTLDELAGRPRRRRTERRSDEPSRP